ncbi:BTAD domain-containing putative transcriptional regulator [Kitasatospora sp. NPDC018058]|uniref:AfsR/SARP family transcriptional regulator n=1 Tax=Kitasatospora sp. NPDC018058 TaxID=3364025 RepID=UPI0037C18A3E
MSSLTVPSDNPRGAMRPTDFGTVHVSLLPDFVCRMDRRVVDLSDIQQRLVAAVVLDDRPVGRHDLAARLWPDVPPARASARLRQTLWRLNQVTVGELLRTSHTTVALAEHVEVDYRTAAGLVSAVSRAGGEAFSGGDRLPQAWSVLRHPLLYGWDDDWLAPFQGKWELQRVQALENLAETFLQRRQHSAVLELADAAAQADPLREGPRRIAVQSCLRAGEVADAHRRYRRYRELLSSELGVSPSSAIPRLLKQDRERQLALAADY